MAYVRFVLPSAPATVANPATVQPPDPQTVAGLATVAGAPREDHRSASPSLASVAAGAGDLSHNSRELLRVAPEDVLIGVERELRALSDDGVTGAEAERRAAAIVAGKIRNSAALAERQAHDGLCHQCREPLDDTRPVVAALRPGGGHLWLHGGACHEAFGARRAALVDRIMAAAGYGA